MKSIALPWLMFTLSVGVTLILLHDCLKHPDAT